MPDRYINTTVFVIDRIIETEHITNLKSALHIYHVNWSMNEHNIHHFRFHDLRHYSASIWHALSILEAYILADGRWAPTKC